MRVLELMNREYNWKEILQEAPYFINIKEKDDYVLLKYNQIFSDFSNEIVRECRGAIFRKNVDGRWICVSRGFDKFMNFEGRVALVPGLRFGILALLGIYYVYPLCLKLANVKNKKVNFLYYVIFVLFIIDAVSRIWLGNNYHV